jgi:flagellar hook-associated protein 3 FlgL
MVFITYQSISAEINRQHKLSQDIAGEQSKISNGKKITRSSDNPQDWVEISNIGRQQSSNDSWQANIQFAIARSAQAESNLNDLNTLMTRVGELIIQAAATGVDSPGREAVAKDLEGIKASVRDLLYEKDYQGTPVFDDAKTVAVPVGKGLTLESVGTRQSISDGVDVNGTPMTLDQILDQAVTAVRSGDEAQRDAALESARKALDHVIVAQSVQGVRSQRVDDAKGRLEDNALALVERRSALEDTDLSETISLLQTKLVTLEAAQSAFARINRQTLFDLLR